MSYVRVNDKEMPFVRSVDTTTAGKTFVWCLTEDEDTERLFDVLKGFRRSDGNFAFEIMNDEGKTVVFDGIISFIIKERYAINFTVEPTGAASIE